MSPFDVKIMLSINSLDGCLCCDESALVVDMIDVIRFRHLFRRLTDAALKLKFQNREYGCNERGVDRCMFRSPNFGYFVRFKNSVSE